MLLLAVAPGALQILSVIPVIETIKSWSKSEITCKSQLGMFN